MKRRFALAAALAPASATLLTLNDFDRRSPASLPVACTIAYNTYITGCLLSDFTNSNSCSAMCVAGLEDIQALVQDACEGVGAKRRSALGAALRGDLITVLCPGGADDGDGDDDKKDSNTTPEPIFETIVPTTTAAAPSTTTTTTNRAAPTTESRTSKETLKETQTETTQESTTQTEAPATETPDPTSVAAPAPTSGVDDDKKDDQKSDDKKDDLDDESDGGSIADVNPEDSAGVGVEVGWAAVVAVAAGLVAAVAM